MFPMTINIHNQTLSVVFRVFVGLILISSSILKYISIDVFDLYVFEHNIFSFSVTEMLTRLLISVECTVGIMLVFKIHVRIAYYTAFIFLVGFTAYLFLLPYLFDVDINNCHCFGEVIVLSRSESIIKNIFLLGCLFFISPKFFTFRKQETWITNALLLLIITVFMVLQAPYYLYNKVHSEKIKIDIQLYETALLNSGKKEKFTDGKQIICMYSVGCEFCKKCAAKLHLIMKNNQLSEDKIKVIFWAETPDSIIYNFFSDQKIFLPEYITFSVDTFLNITAGRMPVVLFSDNGTIVHRKNYVTLNEKDLLNFFK